MTDPGRFRRRSAAARTARPVTVVMTLHAGRILAYVAVTTAFVVSVWLAHDANTRAARVAQNALTLGQENAAIRKVRIRATRETDLKICMAIRTITLRDRKTLTDGPATTGRLLRILGVSPTVAARIVLAQRDGLKAELAARPLLRCSTLPNVKRTPKR